ncbi:hypothetical protein [Halioxenophilus sp. WMMB6]|uniref:hypothetical protein n=1 Tax=Halioxenophilus sp. WMMB6 TaxID=3073815 RepID=UPI00295F5936|nr:hypothetical protein [Halioxenophilus sp. WMMB6]
MKLSYLLAPVALLFGQGSVGNPLPEAPHDLVQADVCPFECCTYGQWQVVAPTNLFQAPAASSPVVAELAAGSQVSAVTGEVHTLQAGHVRVKRAYQSDASGRAYRAGSELFVYSYEGEGFYQVWFHGEMYSEEVSFMAGWDSCEEEETCWGEVLQTPESEWWIQIETPFGERGWSNQPENFAGKDSCG